MPIPTYSNPGELGQIATNSPVEIQQALGDLRNKTVAVIPFGRFVRYDSANNTVALPSATGQTIIGATVQNQYKQPFLDSSGTAGIPVGDLADVLTKGYVWMFCETNTVKPNDPVYVRHTVNGALNQLGAVANVAGTGLDLLPGARFASTASGTIAIVNVNLP